MLRESRVLLLLLAGCQPFVAAGVEKHGASFAAGGGAKDFTIGLNLQAHEVESGPTDDTVDALAASLDFRATFIRWKGFATGIHAGPAYVGLVDMTTGERAFGYGVDYGGQVSLSLSVATLFVDFHRTAMMTDSGTMAGSSWFDGALVGLMLRK